MAGLAGLGLQVASAGLRQKQVGLQLTVELRQEPVGLQLPVELRRLRLLQNVDSRWYRQIWFATNDSVLMAKSVTARTSRLFNMGLPATFNALLAALAASRMALMANICAGTSTNELMSVLAAVKSPASSFCHSS